ncbi:MAG: ABC transporter substrate-binding protein, partial [Thermodesulfobacteriota bacterium]|nr:ABC transporter substrate-binding protein [Thermodesulfobacteriota bacterium]
MMKKIIIIMTVLAFAITGMAIAAPKKGGTLVFGRGGDSVGLDAAYETDGNSFLVCDNIFEALVFYKDESTALEPGL